ncbi:band 4.1-like protein 2 isoform X2 [Syngnathoides biaculeatus]|uniref:band 4.1-like protein 2 isoform X2 n=1 Tax=Syngnathoides biaculeatus TaxID=300417 RepID=UPI002ADD3730|nr:band 4.1-like protein 2 isoform X2 [Syngnathoides biaculeatus]
MTTEAGSETEVKEKEEKPAAGLDQSERATAESQEAAAAEGDAEKEKDGKGISRYLPTWFKKQKSQGQTSPTEEAPSPEKPGGDPEEVPEVNGHAEEVEEREAVGPLRGQVAEKEAERQSDASADTEPAGEEKVVGGAEVAGEGGAGEKEEDEAEERAPAGDGQPSIFQSPLRLVRRSKMKLVVCHVTLLDGSDFACEVEKRAKGLFLFFKVCEHLNLLEKDYFGLTFTDHHEQKCWLDPTKEIKRQIRSNNWQFAFNVKFYPPDPSLLTEDITRYLLCLQLREDVASGRLPCSFVTHALLGSYTLQAEIGDYEPDQPRPLDYISQLTFAPNQSKEMEEKILELHKSHKGMTPAQADAQFLENAKKLSMYGVDLHHAKDSEGVDIMLGVCANGLLVYKDRLRINRFAWPKILKISYKRNNFYIKIRPGETEQFESTVGFKLQNHRSAKRLWKVCVENHSFFRLNAPEPPTTPRFLTLGSKFRYSGRTQTQTRLASTLIDRPAPAFERTSSKRVSRSLDGAPMISITEASRDATENGHEPHLDLHSDSKSPVRVRVDNIYVRHSNLMLEDHDKTQDEVLKHQASVSELKRSFMEAPPASPPQPNLWEKRLSSSPAAATRAQRPAAVPEKEEEAAAAAAENCDAKEVSKTTEVEIEETVVVREISAKAVVPEVPGQEAEEGAGLAQKKKKMKQRDSVSSESESDEEAEYQPNVPVSISRTQIPEEEEEQEKPPEEEVSPPARSENQADEKKEAEEPTATPGDAPNGPAQRQEADARPLAPPHQDHAPKVNGEAAAVDTRPQVICCSQPPVVKTEMVTISDTFAAQKTEIATKEVPIVHTETKTITYEAAQLDGSGDGEPGVLMTAQTITSESLCTTTTTHITKTLKGGLSETRIEKRIVITGDCDIDHDEALAQAIKEAKEQHPDMSVTRVVVHKETELAEEED